jgi:RNA polymerase sigma-70 factor (ECF subfamily)
LSNDQKIENNTEQELMKKFCSGDKNAFKEIFLAYYSKLSWFVERYIKSQETADEIIKELYIDLWEKRDQLNVHTSVKAYLYRAARNRALNYIRSQNTIGRKLPISIIEDEELVIIKSHAKTPYEELEQKELEQAVEEAVGSLPGRTKLVFTLHRDDGLTYAEIANVMEISAKTVENQMARAFRKLREKLSPFMPVLTFLVEEVTRNVMT